MSFMIKTYKEHDDNIWIPVAKGKNGGQARALLPFNGLNGKYTFGFKAAPTSGNYFDALRHVQQGFVDDERQVFLVNKGKDKENQHKARWRHGNNKSSPLLGPTLGWVLLPTIDLMNASDASLEELLIASGGGYAIMQPRAIPPLLCKTPMELEIESSRLFREMSSGKPSGQANPKRTHGSIDLFVRDAAVVAYVLKEAAGYCECCTNPAPFEKPNGVPYLEVHHIVPLASRGSDTISNAVAVCPNCHRELHHGAKGADIVETLYLRIDRLLREQVVAE